MTWFKVDDKLHSHPKVKVTDPAALGLWVVAGSWAADYSTDGLITDAILPTLLPGAAKLARKLVAAGLWERGEGGYRFHDWLDYNPSAEQESARKSAQATRQAKFRERRNASRNASSNALRNASDNGGSHAAPTRPPLKGEGGVAPLRGGGAPPPTTTHKLTTGRVICATHHLEVEPGGICRGCAADATVVDDFDLDQRPPIHNGHQRPNLVATAALDPHGDGTAEATTADAVAEYATAQRDLAASGDAAWWRSEARRVLGERGHIGPKRELVTITAAELYRRSAQETL